MSWFTFTAIENMLKKLFCVFLVLFFSLNISACSTLVSSAKKDFAEDISAAIMESNDPATVGQAIPAYLLLISSMIRGDQNNTDLLVSGSRLYGAYATIFVEDDAVRKIKLAQQSFDYAQKAVCHLHSLICEASNVSFAEYEKHLQLIEKDKVDVLFAFGSAWAGLIDANSTDWNAIAELPKVKATIARVIELDETVSNGDAHLYMGVMHSLLPPAMGGKIDIARQHYEKALEISQQSNLMAMLMYAAKYAFGEFIKKRINLYRKYLSVNNKTYLDWAIKQLIYWNQATPLDGVIQIHGDKDGVFTNSCNENCIVVKGGTHIMIINQYKWFNKNLPKLIVN